MPFVNQVLAALTAQQPADKLRLTAMIAAPQQPPSGELAASETKGVPGRPAQPLLVAPRDVPRRSLHDVAGRAALIHAVAHIEFNAINLALDACWRFTGMPLQFYRDWLSVAPDEARHFSLLQARLQAMGHDYGDFAAHNGLWQAAEKTAHDVLVRMALVPRVLEARGLDVTPAMIQRLRSVPDMETVGILELILREEVRHVEIGSHWYQHLCNQRGIDAQTEFMRLLKEHRMTVQPPLNRPARLRAGFSEAQLDELEARAR